MDHHYGDPEVRILKLLNNFNKVKEFILKYKCYYYFKDSSVRTDEPGAPESGEDDEDNESADVEPPPKKRKTNMEPKTITSKTTIIKPKEDTALQHLGVPEKFRNPSRRVNLKGASVYECVLCDYDVTNLWVLFNHIRRDHFDTALGCNECIWTGWSAQALKSHLNVHK